MSTAQVIQFMEKSAQDEALQQQLQTAMGTGDGDISSINELDASEAAALKGQRGTNVVELAHENGFEFSVDELVQVIDVFEKHQSGKISEDEFTEFISSSDLNQETKDHLFSAEQTVEFMFRGRRYTKKVSPKAQTTTTISAIDRPSSTAITQVIEFMEKTDEDVALQQQLQTAMGVGDGNISSINELDASEAKALKGEYGEAVVNLAKENGFNFSADDLVKVIKIFEQHQSGEMSESEFSDFINSFNLSQQAKDRLAAAEHSVDLIFQGRRYRKTTTKSAAPTSSVTATAQVVQFMEKTADDAALQQEIKQILGVGDGDISSIDELDAEEAQALKSGKNSLIIELAAKHGCSFTTKDLLTVIGLFNQQKFGEISPDDFAQLTGMSDLPKATTVELMYLGRRYRKTNLPNGEVKIEYIDNKQMRANKSTAVVKFMLKTAEDETIKQKVKKVLGVGDGDISTITELDAEEAKALKGDHGPAVTQVAAKFGFEFSMDDLLMVVEAFEQRQSGQISQKEFAQKTGLSELEKESGEGMSLFQKAANFFSRKG